MESIMSSTSYLSRSLLALGLALFFFAEASAGTIAYYRFEGDLSNSAGTGGGSVIGHELYSPSTPSPIVPQTGLPNNQSLGLGLTSVEFNYPFPFNAPGDATLEFWLNPAQLGGGLYQGILWTTTVCCDNNRFNIFLKDNMGGAGWSFNVDYREPDGTLHSLLNSEQPDGVTIPYAVPAEEWTFIALVRSGDTYSVYFNNDQTPVASAIDVNPNLPTDAGWLINGWIQQSGLIDELRLSDSALTPSEFLISSVPEPETYVMMLAGLGLLGFAVCRRKQNQAGA